MRRYRRPPGRDPAPAPQALQRHSAIRVRYSRQSTPVSAISARRLGQGDRQEPEVGGEVERAGPLVGIGAAAWWTGRPGSRGAERADLHGAGAVCPQRGVRPVGGDQHPPVAAHAATAPQAPRGRRGRRGSPATAGGLGEPGQEVRRGHLGPLVRIRRRRRRSSPARSRSGPRPGRSRSPRAPGPPLAGPTAYGRWRAASCVLPVPPRPPRVRAASSAVTSTAVSPGCRLAARPSPVSVRGLGVGERRHQAREHRPGHLPRLLPGFRRGSLTLIAVWSPTACVQPGAPG